MTLKRCELGQQEEAKTISNDGKKTDLNSVHPLKDGLDRQRSVLTAKLETMRKKKVKELGNMWGALQADQGFAPRIHGQPERIFMILGFMYFQPGPNHRQHLNTPILIPQPMLSNQIKTNKVNRNSFIGLVTECYHASKKIHGKVHMGHSSPWSHSETQC